MGDTFGGEWRRPSHSNQGRSQKELQDRASYDNAPNTGCGALFLLCVLALAAALGVALI
ncbi:hypothetical protein ACFWFF_01485 [Streptomyces sp. NPDC060223]|uniref:hypothetical protein n=1 Tax=unclassified Streptomyces TaxID=2593676 RepID=UPI00362A8A82